MSRLIWTLNSQHCNDLALVWVIWFLCHAMLWCHFRIDRYTDCPVPGKVTVSMQFPISCLHWIWNTALRVPQHPPPTRNPESQVKKYIFKISIFWNLQNFVFFNCEILLCFVRARICGMCFPFAFGKTGAEYISFQWLQFLGNQGITTSEPTH